MLFTASCETKRQKEFNFLGLEFGVKLDHKIKDGPRETLPESKDFHQIDFPNAEFDDVLVSLTKNDPNLKVFPNKFLKEDFIWSALFVSRDRSGAFGEADLFKLRNYIIKKYNAQVFFDEKGDLNKITKSKSAYYQNIRLIADEVLFDLIIDNDSTFSEKSVMVKHFGVYKKCSDENGNKQTDEFLKAINESLKDYISIQKRRID